MERSTPASDPVTVIVRLKAKPGMESRVRKELLDLLGPTRSEEGCVNYDMHQAADDDSLFLFHENWTNERVLEKHFEAPHVKRWLKHAEALLAEPMELTRWRRVD